MSLIWLNGVLVDKADARVSPFDHGFLYGDGVWEHVRLFGGVPFGAARHLTRLAAAATALGIDVPLSPDEFLGAIDATAKANGRTEGYVRVIVTRGPGTIGPDPRKIDPQVLVTAEEYRPFPPELYAHGLHAVVAPLRLDPDNPAHRFRTLNQLHVVEAKRHALRHGCLEALFQTRDLDLAGSTEGLLFVVRGRDLDLAAGHVWDEVGSAVATLTENDLGLAERPLKLADLRAADEAFIAGTACGIIGLVRVDGADIGGGTEGPVTRGLRAGYRKLTGGGTG
jgi:branched-chain amino acid aminotransferase